LKEAGEGGVIIEAVAEAEEEKEEEEEEEDGEHNTSCGRAKGGMARGETVQDVALRFGKSVSCDAAAVAVVGLERNATSSSCARRLTRNSSDTHARAQKGAHKRLLIVDNHARGRRRRVEAAFRFRSSFFVRTPKLGIQHRPTQQGTYFYSTPRPLY
jgi:hypothetical protein